MSGRFRRALSQHAFLDRNECDQVRERVLALRRHWTPRFDGEFFTLGVASYLDAPGRHAAYVEAAKISNVVLRGTFGGVYDSLVEFFKRMLDQDVTFHKSCALPGFHIFLLDGRNRSRDQVVSLAHFDLQWMVAFPGVIPEETLSFTLPIAEPTGGASLETWPLRYEEAVALGTTGRVFAKGNASEIVRHVLGQVMVSDGMFLHSIGTSASSSPRGMRITLQGHGVRTRNGWQLYW